MDTTWGWGPINNKWEIDTHKPKRPDPIGSLLATQKECRFRQKYEGSSKVFGDENFPWTSKHHISVMAIVSVHGYCGGFNHNLKMLTENLATPPCYDSNDYW